MENFFLVLELLEQHQDPLFLKLTSAVQAERENLKYHIIAAINLI